MIAAQVRVAATLAAVAAVAANNMHWIATPDGRHYHWMDGDIEVGRIDYYGYSGTTLWIWSLFDLLDIDNAIEGQERTAALAAHALQAEAKAPSYPITLTNEQIIQAH
jgi:hypothetical protein